jgi:hypothetical protein
MRSTASVPNSGEYRSAERRCRMTRTTDRISDEKSMLQKHGSGRALSTLSPEHFGYLPQVLVDPNALLKSNDVGRVQ